MFLLPDISESPVTCFFPHPTYLAIKKQSISTLFRFYFCFPVLGIEPQASCMRGKPSTAELHHPCLILWDRVLVYHPDSPPTHPPPAPVVGWLVWSTMPTLRTAFDTRPWKFEIVSLWCWRGVARIYTQSFPERTQSGKPLMIIVVWFATLSAKNRVLRLGNGDFTGMVAFV